MKCNKAHKWIALYREGELEAGIRGRLREHLAECESCSQLYQAYLKNDLETARMRIHRPLPDSEARITGRILDSLAEMKKHPEETRFKVLMNRTFDIAALPAVRRIAVACILILVAVFSYQQSYIFTNTAKLEKQLSDAGKASLVNAESNNMQDCLKKSARYFSKVKTGQIKIESNLKMDMHENPEVLMQYASLFCSHRNKHFENALIEDLMIIPYSHKE